MNLYRWVVRPLLFQLDAEFVHQTTVSACGCATAWSACRTALRQLYHFSAPELTLQVAGLDFRSPLGLAAGWDKNGVAAALPECLGFGFSEVGSVSADPAPGNPRPRLFRLPQEQALVVNYGLPNSGATAVAERLARFRRTTAGRAASGGGQSHSIPLGINLVSTHRADSAAAAEPDVVIGDYLRSASILHPLADYLMLNLSCPNVGAEGEFFAEPGRIHQLLQALQSLPLQCPVLLKIAPQADRGGLDSLLEQCLPFPFVRGFLFNLPRGRPPGLQWQSWRPEYDRLPGAVAGRPVSSLIDACIQQLYRQMPPGRFAIMAAGGIFSAADAWHKISLGASLLQLYSALIYAGPGVARQILEGLCGLLRREGFRNIAEAVGYRNTERLPRGRSAAGGQ